MEASTGSAPAQSGAAASSSSLSPSTTETSQGAGPVDSSSESSQSRVDQELDFDGEKVPFSKIKDYYKRRKELDRGAYKRMQDAAEAQKKHDAFYRMLSENPEAALRERGIDVDKIAQERMAKKLEELTMSEEDRAKADREREYSAREKALQQREQKQHQFNVQQEINRYSGEIATAIEQHGLPATPEATRRAASLMLEAHRNQINRSMESIAEQVSDEMRDTTRGPLSKLLRDPAKFLDWVGKEHGGEIATAWKSYLLAQASANQPKRTSQAPSNAAKIITSKAHPSGYISLEDYAKIQRR